MGKTGTKKKNNELIRKRKKKILIKRSILLMMFLIAILVTLCLKLPYFNIQKIQVKDSNLVEADVVESLSGVKLGDNIFYLNTRNIKNKICSNTYINDVTISRELPSTLIIKIDEKKVCYYIEDNKTFILLDDKGMLLGRVNSIGNMKNLVQITNAKLQGKKIGQSVSEDKGTLAFLKELASLADRNKTDIKFTSVDIGSSYNFNVNFSNINVKLGGKDELQEKLNKALNIITQGNLKSQKGYIDVSFNGAPVFSIQK